MNREALELRGRILGVLIRDARIHSGRTPEECARFLGVSPETFIAWEEGDRPISLPELEALAYFLNVPLSHFLSDDPQLLGEPPDANIPEFLALRHRIVGVLIRQAREEAGKSLEDLARLLDCTPEQIEAYEYGELPIPLPELEVLAHALDCPMERFLDQGGPLAQGVLQEQRPARSEEDPALRAFRELPPQIQEFVLKPINRSYLEIAMKLAEMPAGKLREIAEGLLEITY